MPFCEHGTGVCCHCQWRRGGAETRAQQHWGQPPHWPVSWHTPSSRWSWSGISSTTRPGTAWVTWAGLWHIASIPCLRKSFRSQLKYDSLQQFGRENKEYTAPDMDGAKFHTLQWDLVDWTEYFRQAVITQKRNVARFTLWVQFWSIKRKYFFKTQCCTSQLWEQCMGPGAGQPSQVCIAMTHCPLLLCSILTSVTRQTWPPPCSSVQSWLLLFIGKFLCWLRIFAKL